MRLMQDSGLLPEGSLQLVIVRTGDLLDRLDGQDVVTFTGSANTAAKLRVTPNLINNSVPFNAEADSLNCAILGHDVSVERPAFELFIQEVAREVTVKAGQNCTAIRRGLLPEDKVDVVCERLSARLDKVTVGDPRLDSVRMGALASFDQKQDVLAQLEVLLESSTLVYGHGSDAGIVGDEVQNGAFVKPTLLLSNDPDAPGGAHDIEADKCFIELTGVDRNIVGNLQPGPRQSCGDVLGKSVFNREGGLGQIEFTSQSIFLPAGVDKYSPNTAINFGMLTGFVEYSFIPAEIKRSLSPVIAFAVKAIMGRELSLIGFSFSHKRIVFVASIPFKFGMFSSIKTRS